MTGTSTAPFDLLAAARGERGAALSSESFALSCEQIVTMQAEIKQLAAQRDAVILAHNYQVPEIQDVADFVGDSLGLSRQAAAAQASTIVFCGVHFMAETASVLCPDKQVLIPDFEAGCSLADTIDADQLRQWKRKHPRAIVVMYVNTSAEVKALTDYCCTSSNAVDVVRHIYETEGEDTEILFGPDMWLGSYVEKRLGKRMHVWDGECHVHAGIRPADLTKMREERPDADLLVHPECGCTTSIMEYVASGEIAGDGVQMLSTGGMLAYAAEAEREVAERAATRSEEGDARGGGQASSRAAHEAHGAEPEPPASREAIVATEVGMLYPLQLAAPDVNFVAANPEATCKFMKMITLPKLRDCLRDGRFEVRVPPDIAKAARVPIDRMVSIG